MNNLDKIKSIIGEELQKSDIEHFDNIDFEFIRKDTLIKVKSKKSTSVYLYFFEKSSCVIHNIGFFTKERANTLINKYSRLPSQINKLFNFVDIMTIERLRRLQKDSSHKKRIAIFYDDNTGYSLCYILEYIIRSRSSLVRIKRIEENAKPFEMEVNASRIYEYNEENSKLLNVWK